MYSNIFSPLSDFGKKPNNIPLPPASCEIDV